ncbi:MAG: hypothetical protein LBR28_02020 [Bacteroidales bacterium]|jgi:hypothetical protein|nr:hypothetical protein [Bacteroidales bacterium]
MELTELKDKIITSFKGNRSDLADILQIIEKDNAVFPFNEYELLINSLIEKKGLTYAKYLEIRQEYINNNPNLWVFEISAPRGFGESFAQTYLSGMCKELQKPSKKFDSNYNGEYDFWLDGIKIEVKASRVVDSKSDEPLYRKALSTHTKRPFLMNFQQLKPQCCDVFVWLAVFRDEIIIWIMSSNEVLLHPDYSKGQHRGNKGNEGQLHIRETNIGTLDKYKFTGKNLKTAIQKAAKRNIN